MNTANIGLLEKYLLNSNLFPNLRSYCGIGFGFSNAFWTISNYKNIKLNEYVICDLISVPVFKNSELFHTNNGVKKTFKIFVHISLIFDATL